MTLPQRLLFCPTATASTRWLFPALPAMYSICAILLIVLKSAFERRFFIDIYQQKKHNNFSRL
jgi:hypothetical protein